MTVHSRGEATISIADSTTRGLADAIRGAGLSISTAVRGDGDANASAHTPAPAGRPCLGGRPGDAPPVRGRWDELRSARSWTGPRRDRHHPRIRMVLADSGTVREVASRIGRTEGRVRQMLRGHELFGIRDDDTWRVPWFQFDGDRPVRGLDRVIGALPGAMHPVAVFRLLTSPSPDLLIQDQPMSPLDRLRSGADPAPIVELAADL